MREYVMSAFTCGERATRNEKRKDAPLKKRKKSRSEYPYEEAVPIALGTLQETVKSMKEVHFVLFEDAVWQEWLEQAKSNFMEITKEDMDVKTA
ncbi:hypothetical protein CBR_g23786 [Chara braunii]|uniref:Uncharacterized protein n=1 Tax=Chara braunii TaxID=69332 RepID=A0A388JVM7_CHABU|nr:hypothetical protein CBR_g23786 [Chara braunii]|eukprot:GBG61830.1 hypothetical protein CBR_g23786 [Chara braunii]